MHGDHAVARAQPPRDERQDGVDASPVPADDEQGARLDGPHVGAPTEVPADGPVYGAGPVLYPDVLPEGREPTAPDAGWLAHVVAEELAEIVDPEPVYLRRPDAAGPGPAKRVS